MQLPYFFCFCPRSTSCTVVLSLSMLTCRCCLHCYLFALNSPETSSPRTLPPLTALCCGKAHADAPLLLPLVDCCSPLPGCNTLQLLLMLMTPCSTAAIFASPATAWSKRCCHCSLHYNVCNHFMHSATMLPKTWCLRPLNALNQSDTKPDVASSFRFLLLLLFAVANVPACCTMQCWGKCWCSCYYCHQLIVTFYNYSGVICYGGCFHLLLCAARHPVLLLPAIATTVLIANMTIFLVVLLVMLMSTPPG